MKICHRKKLKGYTPVVRTMLFQRVKCHICVKVQISQLYQ